MCKITFFSFQVVLTKTDDFLARWCITIHFVVKNGMKRVQNWIKIGLFRFTKELNSCDISSSSSSSSNSSSISSSISSISSRSRGSNVSCKNIIINSNSFKSSCSSSSSSSSSSSKNSSSSGREVL